MLGLCTRRLVTCSSTSCHRVISYLSNHPTSTRLPAKHDTVSLSHRYFMTGGCRRINKNTGQNISAFTGLQNSTDACFKHKIHSAEIQQPSVTSPSRRQQSTMTSPGEDYVFRQLFDNVTFTYTYLLADKDEKVAILIDPVIELADRDEQVVKELGLSLIYAVNTHVHADHVTGTGELKKKFPGCQSIIGESKAVADIHISHGDVIKFGKHHLDCYSTPGHTNGCFTYTWREKKRCFTGDAVLIRGCGRTDFQEGDSATLHKSVHDHIFSLPDDFNIYPAHDYTGQTVTTVAEEKKYNKRLAKPVSEFVEIMNNLKLPYPKQIEYNASDTEHNGDGWGKRISYL